MFRDLTEMEVSSVAGGVGETECNFLDGARTFSYQDWWDRNSDVWGDNNSIIERLLSEPGLLGLSKAANVCPVDHTCLPSGDAKGYYVVDTVDHKVYFSEAGWNAFSNPASVDRWAVFRALMNIAGNSLGGVGAGTAGIIASFALIADWSIGLFQGENTK